MTSFCSMTCKWYTVPLSFVVTSALFMTDLLFFKPIYFTSIITHRSCFRLCCVTYICMNTDIRKMSLVGIMNLVMARDIAFCLPFFHLFTWSLSVTGQIRLSVPKRELSECSLFPSSFFSVDFKLQKAVSNCLFLPLAPVCFLKVCLSFQ